MARRKHLLTLQERWEGRTTLTEEEVIKIATSLDTRLLKFLAEDGVASHWKVKFKARKTLMEDRKTSLGCGVSAGPSKVYV